MSATDEQATGLVLRRRNYSETSLIVAILTPDRGVVHLMVKGGARRSKAGQDVLDLFRIVTASWRPSRTGDLHTARTVSVQDSFEAVARDPDLFAVVGWLSRYILNNSESEGTNPNLYRAFVGLLARIQRGEPPPAAAAWTAIMLAMAQEDGILPHYSDDHDRRFQQIINAICDPDAAFPAYEPNIWAGLRDWCASVYIQSDHTLIDGWQKF